MDTDDPLAVLAAELDRVRLRSAARLGPGDEPALPRLLDVATRAYPALAGRGGALLVTKLLGDAVELASDPEHGDVTARAMLVELGATGPTRHDGYLRRNEAAATEAWTLSGGRPGYSASNHRRPDRRRPRLRTVAAAIQEIERSAAADARPQPELDGPYVERPGPRDRFRRLLRERAGIIVFAGPPGVGKRTLAARLTGRHRGADDAVIRLDASTPLALQHSLITELTRVGVAPGEIAAVPELSLVRYLSSARPPRFVVVEDVPDGTLAEFLSTAASADTTVVVTSGRRLDQLPAARHVEVGGLERDEAIDLVRRLVGPVDDEDAGRLAEELDHNVAALVVACGMIAADEGSDVAGFRRGLRRTVTPILDAAPEHRPAVVGLYRDLREELAREAPAALAVLDLMVVMHGSPIHTAFVVAALGQGDTRTAANTQHLRAVARSALQTLRDRFLVCVEDGSFVSVPHLTRTIVADLIHDRAAEVAARARAGLLQIAATDRRNDPDVPLVEFLGRHDSTVLHVLATMTDPHKSGGPTAHIAHYCRALAAFLEGIGEDPWRVAVVVFEESPGTFSIQRVPVPESADDVEALELVVPLGGPDGIELTKHVDDWRGHKRMLLMMVAREEWTSAAQLLT